VFESLKEVSRGQPCDITGIEGYDMLEREGGVQWPLSGSQVSGLTSQVRQERRLFEDGKFFTPDGRARFVFESPRAVPEPVDAQYPFVLLTGRGTSAQWHTETRTAKSAILRKMHAAELLLDVHPLDAAKIGLRDGGKVRIVSRRAGITAKARLTATVQRGQVFLPMHDPAVNQLTLNVVDPYSRQPAYKHCAVRVEPLGREA
jgi:assimilatory nitrate reductase catalytic subunit